MTKEPHQDPEVFFGSGNVFKDLGYANPEQAQAKADLARQIELIMINRKLTQKQTAEILGIDQPKVSDIIRGKLSKYTLDRLIRFLRLLGRDIEICVKKQKPNSRHVGLYVTGIPMTPRRRPPPLR